MKTKKWSKKILEVKGRKVGNNGKVKVTCAFCDGEGETKTKVYPYKRTCPSCKGNGEFKLFKPAIYCVYCSGKGRDKKDPKVTCLVCRGRGANAVERGFKVCKNCKGSGYLKESKLSCINCRGVGVV